jgi:uncharacterized membrane protein HdeD (DUF308 family)
MSTDKGGSPGPGGSPGDPGYQGAKPGAMTAEDWGLFGASGDAFMRNNAMSAALARNWWAIALRGVFAILFGLIALFLPGVTLASLVLLFAAYMLVDGVFAIVAAVRAARRHERWGLLVFEGIADFAAGAIAFFWPLATILAFVYLMGAWAIVSGVLLWAAAFRLNLVHGRWLMALSGAISVIWGFLLLFWPFTGAIVLTWFMGGYALFFGVALLVLAFRLRRYRNVAPPADALPQGA